jgi:hypothetical protein
MSELTPEERRRIYEEEKARLDAQKQLKAEAKAGKIGKGGYLLGCFTLFIFVFLLLLAFSEESAHRRVQVEPELTQEQKL